MTRRSCIVPSLVLSLLVLPIASVAHPTSPALAAGTLTTNSPVPPGGTLTVTATGCTAGNFVNFSVDVPGVSPLSAQASPGGVAVANFAIPSSATQGNHTVTASGCVSNII